MQFFQKWQAGRFDPTNQVNYPLFPAEVPGNVQYDYVKSLGHDLDWLMFGTNSDSLIETEGWYWEYRTNLEFENSGRVVLVFQGIDYKFDILLNGENLYSGEGMYTTVELDVTDKANKGDLLQVVIHPHPQRVLSEGEPFRSAADRSCKPPVTYGWDWNPRLVISGLWKPAYIETRDAGYISNCEPFYTLNEDLTEAYLEFKTETSAEVEYTIWNPDGEIIYKSKEPKTEIKDIKLWWCNGQGEPNLYRWRAESNTHSVEGLIGFRSFKLVQNEGTNHEPIGFPKSRYAARITPELNGRKVFGKGSNWVNPELFFGRVTYERLEELVIAAKEANMNILRIWGGSGICKPEFYELCDKHGIMVWQEFMLACNCYEGGEDHLEVLEREATSIITALRRHPSIVLWCGGNELFNGWSGMDEQSLSLRLLNALCYKLDKQRPFLPTSPLDGMAHGGYTFIDEYTGKDCFELYSGAHHTAYTEFGNAAIASVDNLKKIIPADELFPIKKTPAWVNHHGFDAWGESRWICLPALEKYFGKADSLEELVANSEWLQCEGYKSIFEEARRQSPYCSMAINWCYQEPWITAAGNSLIAYPMVKKHSYYAVKQALRPTLASARISKFSWGAGETFSAQLWLLNDTYEKEEIEVTATLTLGNQTLATLSWTTGEAYGNKLGPTLNAVLPDVEHLSELKLSLRSNNSEFNSEYRLCYMNQQKPKIIRQMNA